MDACYLILFGIVRVAIELACQYEPCTVLCLPITHATPSRICSNAEPGESISKVCPALMASMYDEHMSGSAYCSLSCQSPYSTNMYRKCHLRSQPAPSAFAIDGRLELLDLYLWLELEWKLNHSGSNGTSIDPCSNSKMYRHYVTSTVMQIPVVLKIAVVPKLSQPQRLCREEIDRQERHHPQTWAIASFSGPQTDG